MIKLSKLVDDERRSFRVTGRESESEQVTTYKALPSVRRVITELMREDTVHLIQGMWERIDLIQTSSSRNRGRNEKLWIGTWTRIYLIQIKEGLGSTTVSALLPPTLHITTSIPLPRQALDLTIPLASRPTLFLTEPIWRTTVFPSVRRWLDSIVTCRMAPTMGRTQTLITMNLRWHSPCHQTMMRWPHIMYEAMCHHYCQILSMAT